MIFVHFPFDRSLNTNSFFKLENVCPIGIIDLRVDIIEKPLIIRPYSYYLRIYNITNVKGTKKANYLGQKALDRKTDTELYINHTIVFADGLPKNGPTEYAFICVASFTPLFFDNLLQAEEWTKNNYVKVEYKANIYQVVIEAFHNKY